MAEFIDAKRLFIGVVDGLKNGQISVQSPLEEIVLRTYGKNLAYVDHRKDAKQRYGYDFWDNLKTDWLMTQGVPERLLYSDSWQFPDFLSKTKEHEENCIGGSLIELKDSKGGSIASFNSTVPTKHKSLQEIDIINGNDLVSRIARVKDGGHTQDENYSSFQRRCLYLVRTHKESDKVKLSIVDGSFFETVPKEHLFYQMFMNVLRAHLEKKKIQISPETLSKVKETLSHITDQTLIAGSQIIKGASVKPRLRIMAEVHPEGNPHSRFYPQIIEGSFNLVLESSPQARKLKREIRERIPEVEVFSIYHKRNGEHIVFQFGRGTHLTQYL